VEGGLSEFYQKGKKRKELCGEANQRGKSLETKRQKMKEIFR